MSYRTVFVLNIEQETATAVFLKTRPYGFMWIPKKAIKGYSIHQHKVDTKDFYAEIIDDVLVTKGYV